MVILDNIQARLALELVKDACNNRIDCECCFRCKLDELKDALKKEVE